MTKKSASADVVKWIALAGKKTGWSVAKLNRHLGKGENTLHRWRAGTMENFELGAIIELCKLAEVSMDDMFEVTHPVTTQVGTEQGDVNLVDLEKRVTEIERTTKAIQPLANIASGFSGLIAQQLIMQAEQIEKEIGSSDPM